MANRALNLPDSPRKLVFRKLVSLLRTNATLKRAVATWKVFDGTSTEDAADFGETEMPGIRVLPFAQGASPESPTTQSSPLGIRIEVFASGYNVDDLLDLWGAVEAAIFTGDGTLTTLAALQAAYPKVIAVRLGSPAITPSPSDLPQGVMCAAGTLTVEMLVKH